MVWASPPTWLRLDLLDQGNHHCRVTINLTTTMQVAFWLLENGYRVLIAACDTFRSGAVEQLRTHTHHLASLHKPQREGGPPSVMLYERGYGKDAAGIAMEAIGFGESLGCVASFTGGGICGCDLQGCG